MSSELLDRFSKAKLVVLQPTSLCNLDCHYCKLPDRKIRYAMSSDAPARILGNLAADVLLDPNVTICWHLGEPLLLDVDYYRHACRAIRSVLPNEISPQFNFQTNGTHLDMAWCEFFQEIDADVGLSLDGPAQIHNSHRPSWSGGPSHHRVEDAARLLQSHCLRHYIIAVLDESCLSNAYEFYQYFKQLGVTKLCLNVEESEGAGTSRFLEDEHNIERLEGFFGALYRIVLGDPDPVWIRELDGMQKGIVQGHPDLPSSQESTLGRIVTVLWNGDVLPYTPGFATVPDPFRGSFVIGNAMDGPLSRTMRWAVLERLIADVQAAVGKCRASCKYYSVCGGGSPAHRWSESHTLTLMETRTCRASVQSLARAVVRNMWDQLAGPMASSQSESVPNR